MLLLQNGKEIATEDGNLLFTEETIMAAWASLTQEQRDIYTVFERDLRSVMGEFQRVCNKFRALDVRYNAQITAILVDLDDNAIPPNASGLAGSSSLDADADMVTLVSYWQGVLTNYNTTAHQQKIAKACGQANM